MRPRELVPVAARLQLCCAAIEIQPGSPQGAATTVDLPQQGAGEAGGREAAECQPDPCKRLFRTIRRSTHLRIVGRPRNWQMPAAMTSQLFVAQQGEHLCKVGRSSFAALVMQQPRKQTTALPRACPLGFRPASATAEASQVGAPQPCSPSICAACSAAVTLAVKFRHCFQRCQRLGGRLPLTTHPNATALSARRWRSSSVPCRRRAPSWVWTWPDRAGHPIAGEEANAAGQLRGRDMRVAPRPERQHAGTAGASRPSKNSSIQLRALMHCLAHSLCKRRDACSLCNFSTVCSNAWRATRCSSAGLQASRWRPVVWVPCQARLHVPVHGLCRVARAHV